MLPRTRFEVRAIQVDGGSEFKAACQEKCLLLFVLRPRSPKLNGRVERAQRTHKQEFYELLDPPDSLDQLRAQLKQEQRYTTYRPHHAAGLQDASGMAASIQRKEVSVRHGPGEWVSCRG